MIQIKHGFVFSLALTVLLGAAEPADEFETLYSLTDGEDVKILKGPAIEARNKHFEGKANQIGMANLDTTGTLHAIFRWRDGKPRWVSTMSAINPSGIDLRSALTHATGLSQQEIEGDVSLFNAFVPGDFLVRDGVEAAKLVPQLETILRRDLEIPAKLTLAKEMRDVVVASGRYKYQPDPGRIVDEGGSQFDHIEVYANEIVGPKARVYPRVVTGGDIQGLFSDLGTRFGARFVDEVKEGPKERLSWRIGTFKENRPIAREDQLPTLQHLSDQTGLDFKVEKREVRILVIERVKPAEE